LNSRLSKEEQLLRYQITNLICEISFGVAKDIGNQMIKEVIQSGWKPVDELSFDLARKLDSYLRELHHPDKDSLSAIESMAELLLHETEIQGEIRS